MSMQLFTTSERASAVSFKGLKFHESKNICSFVAFNDTTATTFFVFAVEFFQPSNNRVLFCGLSFTTDSINVLYCLFKIDEASVFLVGGE